MLVLFGALVVYACVRLGVNSVFVCESCPETMFISKQTIEEYVGGTVYVHTRGASWRPCGLNTQRRAVCFASWGPCGLNTQRGALMYLPRGASCGPCGLRGLPTGSQGGPLAWSPWAFGALGR